MAHIDELPYCCGVGVFADIVYGTPEKSISEAFYGGRVYYNGYVFTEHGANHYGERIADYIREHKLGTVTVSDNFKNPRHPNHRGIRIFVWLPDSKRLAAHVLKLREGTKPAKPKRNFW